MLQTSFLLTKSLNKTEIPISICNVFFVSKGNLLEFYSTPEPIRERPRLTAISPFFLENI